MKNDNPTNFLKRIISVVASIAKAKSLVIKSKAESMKTRLAVFSLLKNKNLSLGTISHKIHTILGQHEKKNEEDDICNAVVLYSTNSSAQVHEYNELQGDNDDHEFKYYDDEDDDEKYPDLTHSLFDDDDENEFGDPNASAIDLVRNSKEDHGENFKLEDDIDNVADLFIKKFHKRMRLQKLESFKRYKDMLERST